MAAFLVVDWLCVSLLLQASGLTVMVLSPTRPTLGKVHRPQVEKMPGGCLVGKDFRHLRHKI